MKVTDLHRVFKLDNPIQPYAWGSHRAIAELLGKKSPSDQPQAEMWMGAHPNGSSRVTNHWHGHPSTSLPAADQTVIFSQAIRRWHGENPRHKAEWGCPV